MCAQRHRPPRRRDKARRYARAWPDTAHARADAPTIRQRIRVSRPHVSTSLSASPSLETTNVRRLRPSVRFQPAHGFAPFEPPGKAARKDIEIVLDTKFFCGVNGPMRVKKKLSCEGNQIRLAGIKYFFRMPRL